MQLQIDGYQIEYQITGAGEQTVVILQGWGTTYAVYDSIAACLGSKYRVVQFDLPGFGKSEEPREPWRVENYADFFVKLMQALSIDRAILLGHSYGGRIILKLTARESLPFVIEKIVMVDAAGIMPKRSFSQKMKIARYKLLKKIVNVKLVYAICPNLIDEWRARQGSADYRNATPIMRQCLVLAVNEDLSHLLSGVKQEVLLIWGENDTATPLSDAEQMEREMQNAGLAVIRGAGHFCFLDAPAQFAAILKSYFHIGG